MSGDSGSGHAKRFAGKKILVTGSSRGIGAGIAKRLAAEGATLAITYASNPAGAETVRASLPGEGHLILQLNIADEASVEAAFKEISEKWGNLDGLVNNAGITKDTLLLRMKTDDFQSVIDTNLKGAFLCTRAAVKMMLKARTGSIVNITSVIGEMGNAGQANYAASKAGVVGFSKSIAQEVASRSIRVNCVAPGFIVTDMTDALNDKAKEAILAKVPLNTLGDVDDVANAAAFLLSNESKYITGHVLSVNGGMYM
ncbi:MAG: 3-oxoacyl-[acyl-carrier-protein] reductase [Proteobacteria bacterium]|nr:MAG: 3-oxoacyl-[acyl-carrier-protein] reductase [Pseudomonadota bacterium]